MKPKSIAIVGAAETTELGRIPELSQVGLHADAALNAMKDCGIGRTPAHESGKGDGVARKRTALPPFQGLIRVFATDPGAYAPGY